ncbi:ATP-binding protein [Andreprevotia chitinilytica]|uniref:ATP-binding protein n=1 Tax=Andreprevotia chitinilytica TaxID=396808 RepID=UPI000555F39A|nr:ATP-binding protein [Andreprevotia chitinilytica]
MAAAIESFEAWDPLESTAGADPGILISAQRREIANILRSYTGYYDLFAELLQNALDAVESRIAEGDLGSDAGKIWIEIDLRTQTVGVVDNGCAMTLQQVQQFLRPNFSFKSGPVTRGSKGVGATYLGYGFNKLLIASRLPSKTICGTIENGRTWVEDRTGTVARPKIVPTDLPVGAFADIKRGTCVTVQLKGDNIRPKNLSWYQANTADQWLALLRIMTPIGGIYINGNGTPKVTISLCVVDQDGKRTEATLKEPSYLYPHTLISRSGSMVEFLSTQQKKIANGQDAAKIPPKFTGLNGLWGQWTATQLVDNPVESFCPIRLSLDAEERLLAKVAGLSIYVYLAFSTDLWDNLNDVQLKLRKGLRVLRGGIQLATRHMPQGMTLTIPMTNNVGFQNLVHVIIHFDQAEPDLGRKGFQPEYVHLAEKIAVSATTAFRRRYALLRKPGVAKIFNDELKIEQWIKNQEQHEQTHGLTIKGKGLFLPTEELPIRSEPLVEQDVVALFNQMLSAGVIRGIQLISSSQYNQYDGLYRVNMQAPYEKYVYGSENPLGIEAEMFASEGSFVTKVKVLEYKYNLNGLIEELQSGEKDVNDIGLVVVWDMGEKWSEMFEVTCLLDPDLQHHRQIHGTTHRFVHSVSGSHAFEAIVLHDLVRYLSDPEAEVKRQRAIDESGDAN